MKIKGKLQALVDSLSPVAVVEAAQCFLRGLCSLSLVVQRLNQARVSNPGVQAIKSNNQINSSRQNLTHKKAA
eukprot:m.122738 g.122738  ORF g.122738 m.122738 type:complete len:73 (+) comp13741_c0_seq1:4569-4787(+)